MFKHKKEEKVMQYKDAFGGFSSKSLVRATWYLKHKSQLRAIFVICFVILDIGLIGYGFWGWSEYAILGYRQDTVMLTNQLIEIEDYTYQQARYGARDVQYASPQIYQSGEGRYDFVIDAQNTNKKWIATITYQFVFNGNTTDEQTMVLMPDSRIPLVSLGVQSPSQPRNVTFKQIGVTWKSIDVHEVPDPAEYMEKRNNFIPGDVIFASADASDTAGHAISFSLTNDSVFSYWSPRFLVEYTDLEKRQGVFLLTIDEFSAGKTEMVDIHSFADTLYVSDVVIHPLINFFDAGEYQK